MFILSIVHLLFFAPPLLYIGLKRSVTPYWAFQSLLFVGAGIFLYHLTRWMYTGSYINAIHVLLIAPLLMFIGWHQKNTPRSAYEILLMIVFAMIGWHTLNLVRLLDLHSETAEKLSDL